MGGGGGGGGGRHRARQQGRREGGREATSTHTSKRASEQAKERVSEGGREEECVKRERKQEQSRGGAHLHLALAHQLGGKGEERVRVLRPARPPRLRRLGSQELCERCGLGADLRVRVCVWGGGEP